MEDIEKKGNEIIDKINENIDKKISDSINEIDKKISDTNEKIETAKADFDTKSKDFEQINDTLKKYNDILVEQGKSINKLNEVKVKEPIISLDTEIKKVSDQISKKISAGERNGWISFKVPTTMLLSTNVTNGDLPQADRDNSYNNLLRRLFVIRQMANNSTTTANVVEWVEQTNLEGGAGNTAEGSAKTQLDWEYNIASTKVEKITSYVKMSEEMIADAPSIQAEINGNLLYQLALQEENQLITGTGVSPQLNGISTYAQTLALASLQNTFTAGQSNYWDVIGAAITQIIQNSLGSFIPNVIFMRPDDVFKMVHASRATTNEYVQPEAVIRVTENGTFVWGIPVIATTALAADTYLVGDMTKYYIKDRERTNIQIGWENDDFTKNLVTIRGENRLATYVKANDVQAFVYDTFTLGTAFLDAP